MEPSLLSLSGFLITFVIDLINRKIADSDVRRAVAYGFALGWGVLMNIIEHNANYSGMTLLGIVTSMLVSATAVLGMSQISFIPWENSDLRDKMQLNAKTVDK